MNERESCTDAVIELYKRSIDRTLLRENLRRTPEERLRQLQALQRFADELRRAGEGPGMRCSSRTRGGTSSPPLHEEQMS